MPSELPIHWAPLVSRITTAHIIATANHGSQNLSRINTDQRQSGTEKNRGIPPPQIPWRWYIVVRFTQEYSIVATFRLAESDCRCILLSYWPIVWRMSTSSRVNVRIWIKHQCRVSKKNVRNLASGSSPPRGSGFISKRHTTAQYVAFAIASCEFTDCLTLSHLKTFNRR